MGEDCGRNSVRDAEQDFDHSSDPNFYAYYEKESLSPATLDRFRRVRDKALELLGARGDGEKKPLRVLDIGCGAGTQALIWASLGHQVHGLDVNGPLIRLAETRAVEQSLSVRFDVGTATALPYSDGAFDVCLMPELLEHVKDWKICIREAVRVLSPNGLLYLSTTNALCPSQQEFNLPLYSWYPAFLKRRYEHLAVSSRPDIANHAKYPAVNWFTFYELRDHLSAFGFECKDRFDMIDTKASSQRSRFLVELIRRVPPLRFLGHMATGGTTIFALRGGPF